MKIFLLLLILGMSLIANDIIVKESSCSVDKTVENIQAVVKGRGLRVFAIINHQSNAHSVDMLMPESKLIIFGNPKIGTSFMLQEMKSGLDLPIKFLVYRDKDQKVKIAYRDGTWLAKEHNLTISTREDKINKAIKKISDKAGLCIKD